MPNQMPIKTPSKESARLTRHATWILTLLLIATSAVTFSVASPMPMVPKADKTWKEISNDDGVLAYKRDVPNTDIVAFRGETTIDAPIAKVANVLIDTSRKKEWVHQIAEAKDIRSISTYERIEYNHTSSGFFLVKDRDFVFHAKAELDRSKNQVYFLIHSVEDPAMPEQGPVRGEIKDGKYTLTRLAPNKTHVVVEIAADPKGNIPMWVVNLFQKSWPTKTLNGIRQQCARTDVQEHAGIKAYFENEAVASNAVSATKKTAAPVTKGGVAAPGPGALQ